VIDQRRSRAAGLGYAAGGLLVLAAFAHAFTGWPPLRVALEAHAVGADTAGALAAGWFFGSAAMLGFGAALIAMARDAGRGTLGSSAPAWAIAAAFAAFGLAAWVLRDVRPHFLAFIAIGALVAAFAVAARRARSG
jgi:hypothetical protein